MPESGQYSSLAEISGVQAGLILEQVEDEIIGYTRKAIASYGNTDLSELNKSQFSAAMYERCAKLQDYAIEAFRKRNDKLFRSVEASLISGFKAGVNDSNRQLGSSFSYNDYNKTIQGGKVAQSARQRLLQAEAKAVDDAVTRLGKAALAIVTVGAGIWGAHDLYSAFDKTYVADLGSGLIGLSTANGSQLALTGYAEGVVRESSHSMRLQGESAVAKDNGYSLVQIHTHNPCCNKCLPFNNVILVDDWFAEAQPDGKHGLLSKAIEQGLFHWNCRCIKRIYHEGGYIKYNDIGTDVKVLKGYELEQEMRRFERSIRGNKLAMQASLEIGTVNRCKEHIAYGQAQLRALTKFAKDNGLPVYRQNWREQIGGETKPYSTYHVRDIDAADRRDKPAIETYNAYYNTLRKSDVEKIKEIVDKANHGASKLFNKIADDIVIAKPDSRLTEAYYSAADGKIHIDLEKNLSDPRRLPYKTFFHEVGHKVDAVISNKADRTVGIASNYESNKYLKVIKVTDSYGNSSNVVKGYTLEEMLIEEAKQAIKNAKGESKSDKQYTLIEELHTLPAQHSNGVSDIFSGVTKNRVLGTWYHDNKYWNKKGSLGNEAFAHIFAASICDEEDLTYIKKYFPKTCSIFDEIIDNANKK